MQALLHVDLVSGSVSGSPGGSAFSWPKLIQGDDLTLSLRLTQQVSGSTLEVSRVVHGLKATLGRVDTRPADGAVKLRLGAAITPTIAFNATAQQVADALNTLSTLTTPQKPVAVTLREGSYLIQTADGTRLDLTVGDNSLWPMSFARIREFEFDGKWMHELRFIQAPVAFINAFARAVPAAPKITEVQQGGSNGTLKWNEVQKLYVPPQFRGNYQIRRGFAKSTLLSLEDGPDEIKAAIASLAETDGEFIVTNPLPNSAHIEFSGSMEGQAWPMLEVAVVDAPEGDLTFTLSLNTEELDTLLRGTPPASGTTSPEVKLPFEVEAVVEDEFDSNTLHTITLLRAEVTVQSELTWEELANYPAIDWLRPPLPRDYVPVTQDQIAVGGQHTRVVLGDGTHREFAVVHNLNEDGLHVTLRENKINGRQLNAAEDYSLVFNDADSLTITVTGDPPANGALALIISTASSRSVFQAHTHSIGQIVGLQAIIDNLGSRVQTLESVVAINAATAEAGATPDEVVAQWTLPSIAEVYPLRIKLDKIESIGGIDQTKLPRAGGLFAAVHAANVETLVLPVPNPAVGFIGRVFQNQSGASVILNGALAHRSVTLLAGEFAACDGRIWYRVSRYGSEKSFYPTDFDRELFVIAVNDKQLRQKKKLDAQFSIEVAVLKSNTQAQWVVVIEHGAFSTDTNPATTGVNLKDVEWNAVPILSQRLILTSDPVVHTFGCRIARSITVVSGVAQDTLTTTRILYGGEEGATGPTTANFALRARLVRFDTEDHQSDPRGFVGLLGLAQGADGKPANDSAQFGKAIIK